MKSNAPIENGHRGRNRHHDPYAYRGLVILDDDDATDAIRVHETHTGSGPHTMWAAVNEPTFLTPAHTHARQSNARVHVSGGFVSEPTDDLATVISHGGANGSPRGGEAELTDSPPPGSVPVQDVLTSHIPHAQPENHVQHDYRVMMCKHIWSGRACAYRTACNYAHDALLLRSYQQNSRALSPMSDALESFEVFAAQGVYVRDPQDVPQQALDARAVVEAQLLDEMRRFKAGVEHALDRNISRLQGEIERMGCAVDEHPQRWRSAYYCMLSMIGQLVDLRARLA